MRGRGGGREGRKGGKTEVVENVPCLTTPPSVPPSLPPSLPLYLGGEVAAGAIVAVGVLVGIQRPLQPEEREGAH